MMLIFCVRLGIQRNSKLIQLFQRFLFFAPFFSLLIRLVLCTIYPEWLIVFHIMLDISALRLKPTEYVLVTDRFKDYLQVSLKVKLIYIDIWRAAFIIFNSWKSLLPQQPKLPKTILISYGGCFLIANIVFVSILEIGCLNFCQNYICFDTTVESL